MTSKQIEPMSLARLQSGPLYGTTFDHAFGTLVQLLQTVDGLYVVAEAVMEPMLLLKSEQFALAAN